jgi:hypothetical protein
MPVNYSIASICYVEMTIRVKRDQTVPIKKNSDFRSGFPISCHAMTRLPPKRNGQCGRPAMVVMTRDGRVGLEVGILLDPARPHRAVDHRLV